MWVKLFWIVSLLRWPTGTGIMPPRQSLLVTLQSDKKGDHPW
jgi:hypothetical protein